MCEAANRYLFLSSLLIAFFTGVTQSSGEDWESVAVPGGQEFRGYAWYRTWVKPHPSFFSKHERDLYGESAVINIRGLSGAHEVFINGKKIGGGGRFPPEFEDGRSGNHRHKIPSGRLVAGQWNEICIRVYNAEGRGGFLSEAPFVMNYFWECVLEGTWEFRQGDATHEQATAGALETKPKNSAFEDFYESNRVLGEAEQLVHGDKLAPEASLSKMLAADGLLVELMLAEPLIAQPTHFSFDSRGRLWVSQYRQYPYPAGLKMLSRDRYYRSHYDKQPPAPPAHDRGRDVISIHEDTNGDGFYDEHKVFQDGLNMANAAIRGRGGVWVMHTPYLLFYPDEDFDDVPDGPPVVHLRGFGMEDSHSVANGLVWGMDGWLYGAQGSTTSCHVTRPGLDSPDAPGVYFQGCMVWRYHSETRRFEIFAEGGGNNFGLEVDSGGRLFTGNNGGKTRGWHYIQGGMHLMQGTTPNKFGPVRNPFAFGELPMMASEQEIPRFTHFATLVESTAIPEEYHGSFFSVEPLHNFVIASQRLEDGATFKTRDIGKALTSDDFAFRPVYIGNAPDGSILIADFYEHYIAHGQHYQSQIDPTTGRIFRLRGQQESLESDVNLYVKSTDQLVALLSHANRWHRHTAVRLLGERQDPASMSPLRELIGRGQPLESLAALWALYQAFGLDEKTALVALQHSDPRVRYWAVRFACDDIGFANKRTTVGLVDSLGELKDGPTRLSPKFLSALVQRAAQEDNAEVRSQLAGSARRLPADQALPLVNVLLAHDEDIDDPYIPLMCWWVLETNLDRARESVMNLLRDREFRSRSMVRRHVLLRIMRGLAQKGKNRDFLQCAELLMLADDEEQVDQLLAGFEQAFAGRQMTGLPERLARVLVENGRSSLELLVRLGDTRAIDTAIELLQDAEASLHERIAVTRVLGEVKPAAGLQSLLAVALAAKDSRLQRAAITATSAFARPEIGQQLLASFADLPEDVRPAFFDLMLSRVEWTRQLVDAISTDQRGNHAMTPDVIPEELAQLLRSYDDKDIAETARKKLGGDVRLDRKVVSARIQKIRDALADGTGNPYAGEATFLERCAACHKLFHKGGHVGPDLTPYQRGNLETLLNSIVEPSAEIREGFEYLKLLTSDGRIITGFATDQDSQIMTLRQKSGEEVRVERDDIEEIAPVGRSLMPDGLLLDLTNQQLRDFFAYLRISQPISK